MRKILLAILAACLLPVAPSARADGIAVATTGTYHAPYRFDQAVLGGRVSRTCAASFTAPQGYRSDALTGTFEEASGVSVRACRGTVMNAGGREFVLGSAPAGMIGEPGTLHLTFAVDSLRTFASGSGAFSGGAYVAVNAQYGKLADLVSIQCVKGACTQGGAARYFDRLMSFSVPVPKIEESLSVWVHWGSYASAGTGAASAAFSGRLLSATLTA